MAEQRQAAEYTAEDIQVLEGMEAVRRRPGMYIGSTDHRGLHHLIYEIVDNAVDEAMAGYCTNVTIHIASDGLVSVEDDGRGIPVDFHPTTGKTAVETVMTTLHAGAKFGGKGYSVSGGLHGVGASVVNALSSWLRVEVKRDGFLHAQEFQKGIALGPLVKGQPASGTGTNTSFMPDGEIFGPPDYDFDTLSQRFKEMAYLNKGLRISLTERLAQATGLLHVEAGVPLRRRDCELRLQPQSRQRSVPSPTLMYIQKTMDSTMVEAAIAVQQPASPSVSFSFANCINTTDGRGHPPHRVPHSTDPRPERLRPQAEADLKDDQPNLVG